MNKCGMKCLQIDTRTAPYLSIRTVCENKAQACESNLQALVVNKGLLSSELKIGANEARVCIVCTYELYIRFTPDQLGDETNSVFSTSRSGTNLVTVDRVTGLKLCRVDDLLS